MVTTLGVPCAAKVSRPTWQVMLVPFAKALAASWTRVFWEMQEAPS
jgi:hypothetical protein